MWLLVLLSVGVMSLLGAFWLSPANKARAQARRALGQIEALRQARQAVDNRSVEIVNNTANAYVLAVRLDRLRSIRVEELKRHASGLRIQALKDAGLNTLADLQNWPANRLIQLRGIGPDSATRVAGITNMLVDQSNQRPIERPTLQSPTGTGRSLIESIFNSRKASILLADPEGRIQGLHDEYHQKCSSVLARTGFFLWLRGFGNRSEILDAIRDAELMTRNLDEGEPHGKLLQFFLGRMREAKNLLDRRPIWNEVVTDMGSAESEYEQVFQSRLGATPPVSHPAGITRGVTSGPVNQSNPVSNQSRTVAPRLQPPTLPPSPYVGYASVGTSSSRPSTAEAAPLWVPPGQEAAVDGFRIPGGMLYLGKGLASVQGYSLEPALIIPGKALARDQADCHLRKTDYWPSYDTITADARASYLQWLVTGRSDPKADLGYVFLYFYGLERRVLWDINSDPRVKEELPLIEAEIRRLLQIYGTSGSFHGYATSLLDFMAARAGLANRPSLPPPSYGRGLSFPLRITLGELAGNERPMGGEIALHWFLSDPTSRIRTAMTRCPDIFRTVFLTEFLRQFPEGMKLPKNKTKLKVGHRPASASFGGQTYTMDLDLPDVTVLSAPIQRIQAIGNSSAESIGAYARYLGRSPGDQHTLEALLLLPVEFWPEGLRDQLLELKGEALTHQGPMVMRAVDLVVRLPEGGELTKARYGSIASALGTLGLGMEPDVRFGGSLPALSDWIVLFPEEGLKEAAPLGAGYPGASLLIHLASSVAAADGDFGVEEHQLLVHHIESSATLTGQEKRRLQARLALSRKTPPSLTGLKKRIEPLDLPMRQEIGDLLVRLVQADGVIDPSEVRSLEKLFKLLGLEVGGLYGRLHVAASEPITVRQAEPTAAAYEIPQPPERTQQPSGLALDMAKVAALKADSMKVAALLGSIFNESEEPEPGSPEVLTQAIEDRPGSALDLDPDHDNLLRVLLQRPQWTRSELEELCSDRGLMVDGAIERINEAAFEHFDKPLLEGDDPLDVNQDLMLEDVA